LRLLLLPFVKFKLWASFRLLLIPTLPTIWTGVDLRRTEICFIRFMDVGVAVVWAEVNPHCHPLAHECCLTPQHVLKHGLAADGCGCGHGGRDSGAGSRFQTHCHARGEAWRGSGLLGDGVWGHRRQPYRGHGGYSERPG